MTLPARLVQLTAAAVVLAWGERLPGGRGFRVLLHAQDEALAADPVAAAAQVTAAMERLGRAGPTQYLWGYARYKQPREEPVS